MSAQHRGLVAALEAEGVEVIVAPASRPRDIKARTSPPASVTTHPGEEPVGPTITAMLRGRCSCKAVFYEVADEFVAAFNCHCSNCRAMSGSMFLPWGEIERDKIRLHTREAALQTIGDPNSGHGLACASCLSLLLWTVGGGWARVPYGTLMDEPTSKPAAHMFVGSKAPWVEIRDNLPQFDQRPPAWR